MRASCACQFRCTRGPGWLVLYRLGEVNPAALDDMVRLCVQLGKLRHGTPDGAGGTGAEGQVPADTTRAWEAIEQAIVGKTIIFLMHSRSTV